MGSKIEMAPGRFPVRGYKMTGGLAPNTIPRTEHVPAPPPTLFLYGHSPLPSVCVIRSARSVCVCGAMLPQWVRLRVLTYG